MASKRTEFYRNSSLAPYLWNIDEDAEEKAGMNHPSTRSSVGGGGGMESSPSVVGLATHQHSPTKQRAVQEADAAAGVPSFHERVSSFGNLLTPIRNQAQTAAETNHMASAEQDEKRRVSRRWAQQHQQQPTVQSQPTTPIVPDWRLRDRMKTVGVGLIVALNCGTDPPDIVKPHPCAVLQCWLDPRKVSRAKAKELIGERLETQYAKWQMARKGGMNYRRALDPTVEDVRNMCMRLRHQARNERVLLHYNGHGVPRPTDHGEIWVFDKGHTEYIPLSIADLKQWCGTPAIVVLDCSGAGVLVPFFTAPSDESSVPGSNNNNSNSMKSLNVPPETADEQASQWVRDTIVLCPCSENEWLPMRPDYPADIFTSCLTTPIPMALRWFVNRNQASMNGLKPEAVDAIPGKAGDRKTPLGELNWIFTSVTDSIAWNVLPKPLFQRLFRQDLLVASMFRNFLLADRILRSLGCTPMSFPPLPHGVSDHPLWQAWDLACETLLFQLMQEGILGNHVLGSSHNDKGKTSNENDVDDHGRDAASVTDTTTPPKPVEPKPDSLASSISSPFFSEQLLAFEVWLEFAEIHKIKLRSGGPNALQSPEHLPVVLQVLLSQVHRIRALRLLRRFLVLGPWAVNLSLSLGIFPYVMKLLQSPEYKSLLVCIWASILAFDPSCRIDVLKDGALHHFAQHLMYGLNSSSIDIAEGAKERTLAAYVLAASCHEYPAGQAECVRLNLHGNCCALLSSYEQGEHAQDDTVELHLPAHFRLWLCICLGSIVKDNVPMQTDAYSAGVHQRLAPRMKDTNADVRAAACYAFGTLIGSQPKGASSRTPSSQDLNVQQTGFLPSQAGLMPQRLANSSGVVVPGGLPAMTTLPGQLQPTFASTASGVATLQLRPLTATRAVSGPQDLHLRPGQSMPVFQPQLNQGNAMQAPYLVPGQALALGNQSGFLVGRSPMVSSNGNHHAANTTQIPQQASFPTMDSRPIMKPTVYEDRHRLELDLLSLETIVCATTDGSVVVRYEATVAIGAAVAKYLDVFILAAEEFSSDGSTEGMGDERKIISVLPRGLERDDVLRFKAVWKVLRSLQRHDPFTQVCRSANEIVSVVHESLLHCKMEHEKSRHQEESRLRGIQEESGDEYVSDTRSRAYAAPEDSHRVHSKKADMRRVSSEVVSATGGMVSMEERARHRSSVRLAIGEKLTSSSNYSFPKSDFYAWQKEKFDPNFEFLNKDGQVPDLLSPLGATLAYQERRKVLMQNYGDCLAKRYASLAPKPPEPLQKSIQMILSEKDETAQLQAEEEASRKKKELQFKEKMLVQNESALTPLLSFHPYENYIMACGGTDTVSLWSTETGKRAAVIRNGNAVGSRLTTSFWINEDTSSLFLVGCDDGTVKIWGSILENNGQCCTSSPKLVSAFHAAKIETKKWSSGLVCDWQPYSGTLIAGGTSKFVHCWDLERQTVVNKLETNSVAEVTTLTTAWDASRLDDGPGSQGIGKDVVVAGQSDGSLKVFDIRTRSVANNLKQKTSKRGKTRLSSYSEHTSWVVTTAFTSYAGRHELISGTLSGEIKAWDLRMSSSTRTMDVQRSTMTTLAVHKKIPLVATGSDAQFIKVVTLDRDTLQVLRYHEKRANHRIGPVSCLSFHPFKPLLGAYFSDGYVGVYSTRRNE